MSFMQKQITSKQSWLEVETTNGTEFLPQDLVANVANCYEDAEDDDSFNKVQQYTEGEPQSWKWIDGYGVRLSAPGYMDCTEWCVFDTQEEAERYLEEMYGDDEEEGAANTALEMLPAVGATGCCSMRPWCRDLQGAGC